MAASESGDGSGGPADGSRRALLKTGVGVLGGGLALLPLAPALGYLVYPLANDVTSSGAGFLPIGKRKSFGGAKPVKVDLYADRVDAWTRAPEVKIGSAWVIELDGRLTAFSTVCPHLGCAIDFDPEAGKFRCPCHKSSFSLRGEVEEGPSPRALDTLEIKEEDARVAIRYCRFRQGVAAKEEL